MTTLLILAGTIFSEAGLEKPAGRRLVADTLYWRATKTGLREVALKPRQYSCWNPDSYRKSTQATLAAVQKMNGPVWRDCLDLAQQLLNGTYKPTTACTHYYNPKLCRPAWARMLVGKVRIGSHIGGQIRP